MKYGDSSHPSVAFSAMNQMRQSGTLCDVTLHVAGTDLLAHRVVLAATSAYFNAMFSSEMMEKTQDRVTMQEVDPVALQLLVEYAYTGHIEISDENVQCLLPAASLLQIDVIREACCSFLLRQLHPSNCLGIHLFAHTHSCEQLQLSSHQYALEHFQEVSATEEFLSLSFEEISSLVSNNQLNVADEETVYSAVMRWLKHNFESRRTHFATLLSYVRLPLISRHFLIEQVLEESLIRQDSEAKDLLIEAMRYHLCPEERTESLHSARTKQRSPDGLEPYIFAIGGGSLFSIHSECEFYNPRDNSWSAVSSTSQRRSRAGVASLNRHIFAIGGYNGTKDMSSVEMYDPLVNAWTPTVSMGSKRSCLGVAALNDMIYAVGGYDGNSCLSSVEKFDPLVSSWFSVQSLEIKRRHCRLTAMNGAIYVVGGFDGGNYLASVERFDPREGKWCGVAPMINRRSSCGVAALGGKLYVAGGNDGNHSCLNSVERYDPLKNAWENVVSMQTRRSTHDMVQVNDIIFAIGGNDGSNSLSTVEAYDPHSSKWTTLKSMILRRSSLGVAVLYCHDLSSYFEPKEDLSSLGPLQGESLVMESKVDKMDKSNEDISLLLP